MKEVFNALKKHRDLILEAERYIWKHPETGYREIKTSEYLAEKFKSLGYSLTMANNIPGFFTVIDTGRKGPEILILGELDCIICPEHEESMPQTGYVHACGHNIQSAVLLGLAACLSEKSVIDKMSGRIRLCAVPAEELIEMDFRDELKRKNIIKYYSGKLEFLYRGYFDGVDMAFMVHASEAFSVTKGTAGCIFKKINYKGVSSHAGGAPWNGKNALYAATQGISAVNSIRETFDDQDLIRFHPIITRGGKAVNAIPELVTMESYVRGKTFDAIKNANKKINIALCGGALSLNTKVNITDIHGYAPLVNNEGLMDIVRQAAEISTPEEKFYFSNSVSAGSTDMGDLCRLMPVVHPYSAGTKGTPHGKDYRVGDPECACIKSAAMQLAMLKLLLENDAQRAKTILTDFQPDFKNKKEYFDFIDSLNQSGEKIIYNNNQTASVKLG